MVLTYGEPAIPKTNVMLEHLPTIGGSD